MTKAQHTPGPWLYMQDMIVAGDCYGKVVAHTNVMMQHPPKKYVIVAEDKANARLIAAAPDLLETLKYCQSWFEKFAPVADLIDGNKCELPMLTSVRAAIKKAEGHE